MVCLNRLFDLCHSKVSICCLPILITPLTVYIKGEISDSTVHGVMILKLSCMNAGDWKFGVNRMR